MSTLLALAYLLYRPTDLTFIRHGETVANATGRYNSSTINSFSDKGKRGVEAVNKQLEAEPPFDEILVSPSPRALYTIAPYLRATHRKATIWPLLYECCTGRRPRDAWPTRFGYGGKIRIPSDLSGLFEELPGESRLPVASDYNSGLAQVAAAVKEFRARFAGRRILLVGHSGQGGHMLHALAGRWQKVDNAKEIRLTLP